MEKVPSLGKKFDDAGVLVEIDKVDGIFAMTDDVVDYEFTLAQEPRGQGDLDQLPCPTRSASGSSRTSTR